MKFCESHWTALRAAIDARGLTPFVPQGGEQAAQRMAASLTGDASRAAFDPLMAAHNAILANALRVLGLGLMVARPEGGEYCPLCELLAGCACPDRGTDKCSYARWIDRAADEAADAARALGLLGSG
jgi:hypothetical protein